MGHPAVGLRVHCERVGQRAPSIIDPHGHHLADAIWAPHGMARFAEKYRDRLNGELRVLDFTLPHVHEKVLQETDAYSAYDR